jgi:hypothetical protein
LGGIPQESRDFEVWPQNKCPVSKVGLVLLTIVVSTLVLGALQLAGHQSYDPKFGS